MTTYDDKTNVLVRVFDVVRELEKLSGARFDLEKFWTITDIFPEVPKNDSQLIVRFVYMWFDMMLTGQMMKIHDEPVWTGSLTDVKVPNWLHVWRNRVQDLIRQEQEKSDYTLKALLSHKDRSEVLAIMDENDREMQQTLERIGEPA